MIPHSLMTQAQIYAEASRLYVDNIASEYGYNTQTVSGDYDLRFGSWDADFVGHGTHVAGIIGAVGNNGLGITGVNWDVKIIPVRIFDNTSAYETISYEIRALNYIASLLQKNPSMKLVALNFSLGSTLPITPSEMENDVYYMAYQALDSLNRTLIIIGAGISGVEAGESALLMTLQAAMSSRRDTIFILLHSPG